MNRCIRWLLGCLPVVLLGLSTSSARADLVISATNVTLQPGQTGTMDFTIHSTTGTDRLQSFNIELLITQGGGTTSLLQFTSSQPNPYGNANYVFGADSLGAGPPSTPFWGAPQTTNYPNDTLSGGDATASGNAVTVPTASTGPGTYLATAQFQAPAGATPGDSFTISLVNDPNQTFFNDASSNPITYTSSPGSVLITSAATPEPSSFLLAGTACAGGLFLFWRKRRGKAIG